MWPPNARQETNHYLNGTSGLKAATLPPPGNYWLAYNYCYSADRLQGPGGETVFGATGKPLQLNVETFASAIASCLSRTRGSSAPTTPGFVVPFVYNQVQITDFGIQDSSTTFGDFYLEPFVMEWHEPRYDFGFLYGFIAPPADAASSPCPIRARNCWTNYFGFGGTYFFDEAHLDCVHFESLRVHTKRRGQDIVPGDDFSFEWGLGKTSRNRSPSAFPATVLGTSPGTAARRPSTPARITRDSPSESCRPSSPNSSSACSAAARRDAPSAIGRRARSSR